MRLRTYRSLRRVIGNRALIVALLLAILIHLHPVLGQAPREFDQLIGDWEGKGELFGVEATFSMTWTWLFGRQFLRLNFQNSIPMSDGQERVLRGRGFYKYMEDGSVEGTWLDSRGMMLPLRGGIEEGRLDVKWGTPKTEVGRTVYRILDNDHVHAVDFVLKEGEWEQFGSAHYTRVKEEEEVSP